MKKSILTILTLSICLFASAQNKPAILKKGKQTESKPDTAKHQAKIYTLYIQADSIGYIQLTQSLEKISKNLDDSNIQHDQVKADQSFIIALFNTWEAEKKAQDQKIISKKP